MLMKVAMLAPDESYEKGISTYAIKLIEAIKEEGISIESVKYKNRKLFSLLRVIPNLKGYDVIHIHHENRLFGIIDGIWFMPFITLLRIFSRAKIIMTFHTVHTRDEQLFSLHPFLNFLKRNFTHPLNYIFANLFADKFIVMAPFLKEKLSQASPIKKEKIVFIPPGINFNTPKFDKSKSKEELNLKGFVYLIIGTLGQNKGVDLILTQAKKIGKTILIAGNLGGSKQGYAEELQDYVKKNGLNKIVRLDLMNEIPSKSPPLWWKYFSAADLILLPYRVTTTSGIFIDAMSSERPVVSSNLDYFREISKNYGCIKIAKKVEDYPKVIKEALKQHKFMEKEARRFKRLNDISLVGMKHKELYKEVINQDKSLLKKRLT